MSEQDEAIRNIVAAGTADLKALLDDMAMSNELTVLEVLRFGPFLARAWVAGAKAFQTEVMARSIEEDADFDSLLRPDGGAEG